MGLKAVLDREGSLFFVFSALRWILIVSCALDTIDVLDSECGLDEMQSLAYGS